MDRAGSPARNRGRRPRRSDGHPDHHRLLGCGPDDVSGADPRPGKRPAGELGNYFDALKPLRRLYGSTPAKEFGPLRLKALREAMVGMGRCRSYVNRQVDRIKRVFKWAVGDDLLPGELYDRLSAVEALRIGRTQAPESEPVEPVA